MNNPPAFPQTHSLQNNLPEVSGMTLRDYFAAAAMQGGLSGTLSHPDADLMQEIDWKKSSHRFLQSC